jgi:hypothetical protein
MAFPSRVQGAGQSGGATTAICGDVSSNLTATGSTATDALQLSAVVSRVGTAASGTGVKLPAAEAGAMVVVRNDGAQSLRRVLAASATSVWPAIPSVICTVTQVNNL